MNFGRIQEISQKNGWKIWDIRPGMAIEIHENVGEGDSKRIWKFKGLVIKVKKPQNHDGTFTVRGDVAGNIIEKIYPLSFPKIEKILLSDEYNIRRAKLYYLRDKIGKGAKMKSKLTADQRGVKIEKK